MIPTLLSLMACSEPYVRIFSPLEGEEFVAGDEVEVYGVLIVPPGAQQDPVLVLAHNSEEVSADLVQIEDAEAGTRTFSTTILAAAGTGWIRAEFSGSSGEDADVATYHASEAVAESR